MRIDIEKLKPEELLLLTQSADKRLEVLAETEPLLATARQLLAEAIDKRTLVGGEIRGLRAEILRLECIIKPRRRRAKAPDEGCKTEVAAPKRARRRKD